MSDGAKSNADSHYTSVCCGAPTDCMPDGAKSRAQGFFAQLAAEIRKPHFGVHQREFIVALLNRAQEAGLYAPPKETE